MIQDQTELSSIDEPIAVEDLPIVRELSKADHFAALSDKDREDILSKMTDADKESLAYDWNFWGRPKQIAPPGDWRYWLTLAGRGYGKTVLAANYIIQEVYKAEKKGKKLIIGLFGSNFAEIEKVMITGKSGILNQGNPKNRPTWVGGNKRELTWRDKNGKVIAIAYAMTGEKPDAIRGFEFDLVWIDELAKFKYLSKVWDQLKFASGRIEPPKTIITTTPKPLALLRQLVDNPKCHVTRGSSYENHLLSEDYIEEINQFKGTRLGAQEIFGAILDDAKGALWSRDLIKKLSLIEYQQKYHKDWNKDIPFTMQDFLKDMLLIVIAVDPATTVTIKSDETGIIIAAKDKQGYGYIIDDLSGKYTVEQWATIVNKAYLKYGAKLVIAETNQGGDMVEYSMKSINKSIKVKKIHAKDGKIARAEPISLLYEQGKIIHMKENFLLLEDQMCNFVGKHIKPDEDDVDIGSKILSPDRMDAMVYSLTELFLQGKREPARGMMDFDF
jgi:phage terminase large subunit-like protein